MNGLANAGGIGEQTGPNVVKDNLIFAVSEPREVHYSSMKGILPLHQSLVSRRRAMSLKDTTSPICAAEVVSPKNAVAQTSKFTRPRHKAQNTRHHCFFDALYLRDERPKPKIVLPWSLPGICM